jgi:hypothetical protein
MNSEHQYDDNPSVDPVQRSAQHMAHVALRWSVSGGAVFALAVLLVALLGSSAEDNWVAVVLLAAMVAGIFTSLAALVLGLIARVRGAHAPWSWVPLVVFPAIIAFLVLGEAFWWE